MSSGKFPGKSDFQEKKITLSGFNKWIFQTYIQEICSQFSYSSLYKISFFFQSLCTLSYMHTMYIMHNMLCLPRYINMGILQSLVFFN